MNANELADELAKVIDVRHYASEVLRKEVIKTLRQQQAEIEVLKQQLVTTSSEAKLNYNKGHEDGRKLAVVKELTNDEMRKVINEIVDGVTVSEMVTFLTISKAILRKAQEK